MSPECWATFQRERIKFGLPRVARTLHKIFRAEILVKLEVKAGYMNRRKWTLVLRERRELLQHLEMERKLVELFKIVLSK